MLRSLLISNYVLIEHLNIEFSKGFTAITGETGAGKSILLGAIAIVTGERADLTLIRNREKKCIVEAIFDPKKLIPESFFTDNGIEQLPELILRRELLPGGTSRAFINDSPVNLTLLRQLGALIIDIHSQHENLLVKDNHFQLNVIDSLAGNDPVLEEYSKLFVEYQQLKSELADVVERKDLARKEFDYLVFQFQQIEDVGLQEGELQDLENEQNIMSNAEGILTHLETCVNILENGVPSVVGGLKEVLLQIDFLKKHLPVAETWAERTQSCYVELRDILSEMEKQAVGIEVNPRRTEEVKERLDIIYSLLHKHRVETDTDLIALRDSLKTKIDSVEAISDEEDGIRKQLDETETKLNAKAETLSKKRYVVAKSFEKSLKEMAADLGMPHVQIEAKLTKAANFNTHGIDEIQYLFTANPKMPMVDISKAASGGELSRIMLCLKSMVATNRQTPVLIFDEIDTGLSGEIAHKMSLMLCKLSDSSQVIAITHLPQIAASGNEHMLVYKTSDKAEALTSIKKLTHEERVEELAKMLSGKEVTAAAVKNAKVLLGQ